MKSSCGLDAPADIASNIPANAVGFIHTHPFKKGEDRRSICGENVEKKYVPGYSLADYEFILAVATVKGNFSFKGYVVDGDKITKYDFRGPSGQEQFKRCGY